MRYNFALKTIQTNTQNDSEVIYWDFANTEEEIKALIEKYEEQQKQWNFHTPGAVSFRYYEHRMYDRTTFLEAPVEDLVGLTLKQIFEFIWGKSPS